jgi:hypothetical protein
VDNLSIQELDFSRSDSGVTCSLGDVEIYLDFDEVSKLRDWLSSVIDKKNRTLYLVKDIQQLSLWFTGKELDSIPDIYYCNQYKIQPFGRKHFRHGDFLGVDANNNFVVQGDFLDLLVIEIKDNAFKQAIYQLIENS